MVNLRTQKRVAAAVLKCGRGRVWIDPNEADQISQANSSTLHIKQESQLESWLRMVLSWRRRLLFIQEPELEDMLKLKDLEDIQVMERERVPDKLECPLKSFGSEDKES